MQRPNGAKAFLFLLWTRYHFLPISLKRRQQLEEETEKFRFFFGSHSKNMNADGTDGTVKQ
jgi:hypothetical protein